MPFKSSSMTNFEDDEPKYGPHIPSLALFVHKSFMNAGTK